MVRDAKYKIPRYLLGLDELMKPTPRCRNQRPFRFDEQENNLLFNMLLFLRAHVVCLQEAWML